MANKEHITVGKLKKAINGSYGIINNVAKLAGCTTRTVYTKLKTHPELQQMLENEKDILQTTIDDLADITILEALKGKNVRVAMWAKERAEAKKETEQAENSVNIYVNDLKADNEQ